MILNKKVRLNLLLRRWLVEYEKIQSGFDKFWFENEGREYRLYVYALIFNNKEKNEILNLYPDILKMKVVPSYPTGWNFRVYKKTQKTYAKHHLTLIVNNIYEEVKTVHVMCEDVVIASVIFPLTQVGIRMGNILLLDMLEDIVNNGYYVQLRREQQIRDILNH